MCRLPYYIILIHNVWPDAPSSVERYQFLSRPTIWDIRTAIIESALCSEAKDRAMKIVAENKHEFTSGSLYINNTGVGR